MAEGRESAEWERTSLIASFIWANFRSQFEKGKQPQALLPDDLNPYARKKAKQPENRATETKLAFAAMKAIWTKKKKRTQAASSLSAAETKPTN